MQAKYKSIRQVCEAYGMSRAWITRLAATGRIAGARKVGCYWIIPEKWKPQRQRRPRSDAPG